MKTILTCSECGRECFISEVCISNREVVCIPCLGYEAGQDSVVKEHKPVTIYKDKMQKPFNGIDISKVNKT